jgi:hypothetical protein
VYSCVEIGFSDDGFFVLLFALSSKPLKRVKHDKWGRFDKTNFASVAAEQSALLDSCPEWLLLKNWLMTVLFFTKRNPLTTYITST